MITITARSTHARRTLTTVAVAVVLSAGSLVTASVQGSNLLLNGDFEAGNTGFTSDYLFTEAHVGDGYGTYSIVVDPTDWWSAPTIASFGDHTSGAGLMLVADASLASEIVWRQQVTVEAGTSYAFRAWITELYDDPTFNAILEVRFNGETLAAAETLDDAGVWRQLCGPAWTAPASGRLIVELAEVSGGTAAGANFALDDLVLTDCPADLDADGAVGATDLLALLANWGDAAGSCTVDLDGDGAVGTGDLLMLLAAWGGC